MSSLPPLPAYLPAGLPWAGIAGSAPPPPASDLSSLQATIGGQLVNILHGSVTGDQAVAQRSQLSFQVYDELAQYAFMEGQPVVLMDANGNVLMNRWVSDAQRTRASQSGLLLHTITCVDNHYLADKRLAPYTATNRLAGDIFRDLVTQFLASEGVTVTAVDNGPTIGSFISNYAQVSACFDALCQKAQGYTWWIDDHRQAYFVTSNPQPAPTTITDALFERDTEAVTHGNPQYRNTQYMLGGTAETSTQTETFPGDGQTTSFTVGYALSQVPTITVNGAAQTVGIKQVDTGKQWYWAKGDNTIAQDSSGTPLAGVNGSTPADQLQITYVGQYPSVAISQDASGVTGRQSREGGSTSGIVEAAATDTTLSTTTDAFAAAAGYLARYSQDSLTLTFVTQTAGFAQGQLATVNVPAYQLNNVAMLIESVHLSDVGPANGEVGVLYYTVKAVKGPLNTSWVQFFGALAGQTQTFVDSINVGASGNVSILAEGAVALSWTVTGSATVVTYGYPSATTYPSPSTYPGTAGAPVAITWTKTNVGLNALRDALTGAAGAPKLDGLTGYFAWGTGTQATPATASGLAAEAGRKPITSNVNGASVGEDLITGLLGPADGVGVAVTEVAFFANASATAGSGTMLLYGLYSHTHTANESVQVVADSVIS